MKALKMVPMIGEIGGRGVEDGLAAPPRDPPSGTVARRREGGKRPRDGRAAHVEARPRTRVWKAPLTATGDAEPPSEIIHAWSACVGRWEEEGALRLPARASGSSPLNAKRA